MTNEFGTLVQGSFMEFKRHCANMKELFIWIVEYKSIDISVNKKVDNLD